MFCTSLGTPLKGSRECHNNFAMITFRYIHSSSVHTTRTATHDDLTGLYSEQCCLKGRSMICEQTRPTVQTGKAPLEWSGSFGNISQSVSPTSFQAFACTDTTRLALKFLFLVFSLRFRFTEARIFNESYVTLLFIWGRLTFRTRWQRWRDWIPVLWGDSG
jgi:hypothetical protein